MNLESLQESISIQDAAPRISLGKLRGLQQLANRSGGIAIVAIDHQNALKAALFEGHPAYATDYAELVEEKLRVVRTLSPYTSAFLLDAPYGAAQAIAASVLPGNVGLVVALEKPTYDGTADARTNAPLDSWSVAKIKQLGASAVKCELFYHPQARTARQQEELVSRIAQECVRYDLPFILEPVSYAIHPDQPKESQEFARQKPEIVLESAYRLSRLGADILKCEFPVDLRYEQDEARIAGYCRQLTNCSAVPWVLLSAALPFKTFLYQLRIACQEGASGFTAGRAIWQEAMILPEAQQRERYLSEIASERLQQLGDMVRQFARPWYEQYPGVEIVEGWYRHYEVQ